jgi:REP element-mobilizing transposase RayT
MPCIARAATRQPRDGLNFFEPGDVLILATINMESLKRYLTMIEAKHPQRKNSRLLGYDYSQPGAYFVTICSQDRRCILGSIIEFEASLSEIGKIVQDCWLSLPLWFSNVALDEFVVMPNHVHGILQMNHSTHSLRTVIGSFKSAATRTSRQKGLHTNQILWQRGYFERVIRSEKALFNLRKYILDNPINWGVDDELNPVRRMPRAMHGIAPTIK